MLKVWTCSRVHGLSLTLSLQLTIFTAMSGYTKLFQSILDSSIWCEDDQTRIVWITLLAKANRDGIVESAVPALANTARVDKEACRAALEKFKAPDPDSRSKENEGRRIEEVEGGWKILNHHKYREKLSLEQRREYFRKKRQEYRQRERAANKGLGAREIVNRNVAAEESL